MPADVILSFPATRIPDVAPQDMRHVRLAPTLSVDELATARLAIRWSLLLLDIVLFRLRADMPPRMRELFASEFATVDELLDSARGAARRI